MIAIPSAGLFPLVRILNLPFISVVNFCFFVEVYFAVYKSWLRGTGL